MGASAADLNYRAVLRPSPRAVTWVVASGAATLALIVALPCGALARSALALAAGGLWLDACRVVALRRGARGIREIVLRGIELEVRDARNRWRAGHLVDGSFVAPWLTIVRWRPQGARYDRTIVILPDMLERDAFRRLRVLLRWR